jgi:TP901 family phage tail tape measure protein
MPPIRVELIAEIKEFMAKMKEAEHGLGKVGDKATYTKDKMAALGQKMATGVLAGVGGTLILATKYALEFQASIEKIGLQANVSEEELHRLHGAILDVSTATATSAQDIATAYLAVEKAGIKGAQADEMVTQAAKLAKVAHADLNQTISAGIAIQQLGIATGLNTTQMFDVLYGAVKNTKLSMDELTSVFQGKAALAIVNYGIKLNEVAGVAGVFKKANMDASGGIAGLQLALAKMTTVNDKANDRLKTVGLTQAQIAADLKKPNGLVTMLTDLASHITKSGMPLQQFVNSLVGARGGAGIGFLIKQLPALQQMSQGAGASVKDAFGEWLKNPEGAMAKFKTTLQNTLIKLGDHILPSVTKVLNWVNSFTDKLQHSPGLRNAFKYALEAAITASAGLKLKKMFESVFGSMSQRAQTAATVANTAAIDANTAALLGKKIGGLPVPGPSWIERLKGAGMSSLKTIGGGAVGGAALWGLLNKYVKIPDMLHGFQNLVPGGVSNVGGPAPTKTKHTVTVKVH